MSTDEEASGRRSAIDAEQVDAVLAAAVAAIGGSERPGQGTMARAVATAISGPETHHLLVQAGTGTGKSLAYLVPALLHALADDRPVVVATATLALQSQLVDRDLPRLIEAAEPLLDRRPSYAMLKGRRNYVCKHRLNEGAPEDPDEGLFAPPPASPLGQEVQRLREWATTTSTGDRDELTPGASERAWSQLAVSSWDCLGAARCPYGAECFAEAARSGAARADIVVTNHTLLALAAMDNLSLMPEHDTVIVDEAHELVDRFTAVATYDITARAVERAAKRCRRLVADEEADRLAAAADQLLDALGPAEAGRLDALPDALVTALVAVRETAAAATRSLARGRSERGDLGDLDDAARRAASGDVEQIARTAARLVAHDERDVAWLTESDRRGRVLYVAPLAVAGVLGETLFADRTVVLTSATLRLGGTFEPASRALGLRRPGDNAGWEGLDVGSPFDYARQSILYVAAHLPPPSRDGTSAEALDELAALVAAAGGRTLGLFSSRRAAETAAAALRERLELPILCQGDDSTPELVRAFASDAATCLFGTLSLWQGVDVPGSACQLVVVDRIPFPRPDDPLSSARARAVERAGGNGFMQVAATHAALKLAQGAGRLIRTAEDRGVVAVLDARLANARYGEFLRASLPGFWPTTDPQVVRRSLAALDAAAPEPLPVAERVLRPLITSAPVVGTPA